jgi:adenine-specific DNA-methyltransferase
MDKLKMRTPDLTDKNIEQIAALFPNVITEIKDENDNLLKAVDFDLLKQVLSKNLVEADDERYRLDWPGKKASLLKANTPINKTVRPCREESVNFDTTENLYIEGDNFEVLKILQESYLGKVKMIYIDPPYNTGKDFIYKDDFKKSKEEYEEKLGVEDEDGGKLFRNTDSNGRFHSDWLSMMYERLIVARDLLKDDGVVFISIDENEFTNLKKILNEMFGEQNYIGEFVWKNKHGGGGDSPFIVKEHEFVVFYTKNIQELPNLFAQPPDAYEKMFREEDVNGKFYYDRLDKKGIDSNRPNLIFPIECPDGLMKDISPAIWRLSKSEFERRKALNQVGFKKDKNDDWQIYTKTYLYDEDGNRRRVKARSILKQEMVGFTQNGNKEMESIFGSRIFQNPKPVNFLKYIQDFITDQDSIILDFFSGSATSAHATMQLNAEDGGNRKFIMVQLHEKTDEKSEAYKAGYKTIAEIGKERIRRAGTQIMNDKLSMMNEKKKKINEPSLFDKESNSPLSLDIGFRVYKTDSTNMKDVFYHPSELKQMTLDDLLSNIKEDRTPEDLLTQVILDLGLELSLPIETKKILGNTVFIVQTNALVACFDKNIDFKIVDTIADLKPFKVVFKDASFKDDKDRINVEERFKRLSPETKVTVI